MHGTGVDAVEQAPQISSADKERSESPPLQEFDQLYQTVQKQLKQWQDEQSVLRSNLESVVQENQSLSEQLQSELSKRSSSETYVKSLNSNIKLQLDAAIQERNSAVEMWQTSLKLVTALENELKDYRDNSRLTSAVDKVNEVRAEYSRAINLLEGKLDAASSRIAKDKAARDVAEEKILQLESDHKLLNERYEKRCADLDEALIGKEIIVKRVEELEKMYLEAAADAKESKLACSDLEAALERSLARLEEVLNKENEAREKVDEALQIVDVALIERDSALQTANKASEHAQQLQATIGELIAEAGTEVQAEAEQIKEQYNGRIKTILLDMRRLQVENKNKNTQIQKLKSDLNALDAELQRNKRELDVALKDRPSLSALDRKLEGLFRTQELAGGESIRADLEIEQLKAEIIKLTQSNDLEQRQYMLERHVLEEQICVLQTEVESSSRTISEFSTKIDVLTATLRQKDHDINVLKKALSTDLSSRPNVGERCSCGSIKRGADQLHMWDDSQKIYKELQVQIDKQRELANKWKSEVNLITARFQSRLRELHMEASTLRKENREMRKELQTINSNAFNNDNASVWR